MIWGTGIDICSVARIQPIQERVATEILTDIERDQYWCLIPAQQVLFVASRFAVKEAVAKALGLGLRAPMTWQSVATQSQDSGRCVIVLYGELATWVQQRGLRVHCSISHEQDYAVAVAVVEHDTSGPAYSRDAQ